MSQMKLLFKKQDLSIVPRWTDNIKDEWINPFITESCEDNFRNSISTTLYDAMANLVNPIVLGTQGEEWNNTDTFSIGSIVLYNQVYYIALDAIIAAQPAPDVNSDWEVQPLVNFWATYVKPYLVYACYKSFVLWHGKHISQGGMRKHIDNTSFEINSDELGYLIGDLKNKISLKLVAMNNYLSGVDYTFSNVKYDLNENVKRGSNSISIFAV